MLPHVTIFRFSQEVKEKIERQIQRAEELGALGDSLGEKEMLVNDLIKVHQRFQGRIQEYRTLLTMSIKFYKDLSEVRKWLTP